MSLGSSTHFKELTHEEKWKRLNQARRLNSSFTFWAKGSKEKIRTEIKDLWQDKDIILVLNQKLVSIAKGDILYSFIVNGLSFFGKAKLKSDEGDHSVIDVKDALYKGERRGAFRLLTYPHLNVFVKLPIPQQERVSGNLFNFKTKMSETNLFKNFLKLVSNNEGEKNSLGGYFPFRVVDISVSGLAFQLGSFESEFFSVNDIIENIFIDFKGIDIPIPRAQVVYKISMINTLSKDKTLKVGIQFLDVDLVIDQKLGSLINQTLRDVETDFEDFV